MRQISRNIQLSCKRALYFCPKPCKIALYFCPAEEHNISAKKPCVSAKSPAEPFCKSHSNWLFCDPNWALLRIFPECLPAKVWVLALAFVENYRTFGRKFRALLQERYVLPFFS